MKKRDFVCNICGAAFGSNNVLRGHLMIHQGIKTEKCDVRLSFLDFWFTFLKIMYFSSVRKVSTRSRSWRSTWEPTRQEFPSNFSVDILTIKNLLLGWEKLWMPDMPGKVLHKLQYDSPRQECPSEDSKAAAGSVRLSEVLLGSECANNCVDP